MLRCREHGLEHLQMHDAYDLIEEEFNQQLDESLDPSGPDSLFGWSDAGVLTTVRPGRAAVPG
jgi:hypothetical protein